MVWIVWLMVIVLGMMTDSRFDKLEKRVKELELDLCGKSREDEK
jgi:hypothetical protein